MLKIKEMREAKKLTQQELADMLSLDRTTVNKWETGVNSPTAKTLLRIADALECKVEDIFCSDG